MKGCTATAAEADVQWEEKKHSDENDEEKDDANSGVF